MSPAEFERDVLDFVREMVGGGTPPALALIARRFDTTESEARAVVDSLIAQGFLFRREGRNRPLAVRGVADLRSTSTDALVAELRRRRIDVRVPGRIATRGSKTCAADCCGEPVSIGHLMCRHHWFMLPATTRQGLLRTFNAGESVAFERLLTRARDLIDGGTWSIAS